MHHMPRRAVILAWLLLLVAATPASRAAVLSFDVFTDAGKTTRHPIGTFIPQAYGDNITDFNPSFYTYGSAGGLTPNITVSYRFLSSVNPTSNNPNVNGESNGILYDTGYGDLSHVLYDIYGTAPPDLWFQEIRFSAPSGYLITLSSFDIAAWNPNAPVSGQTLKIVMNANSPSAVTLWSAGPDGTVAVNGGAGVHDSYLPNVTVGGGNTLSQIYGLSGLIAVDNIEFAQSIPEPSAAALLGMVGLVWCRRRRRWC